MALLESSGADFFVRGGGTYVFGPAYSRPFTRRHAAIPLTDESEAHASSPVRLDARRRTRRRHPRPRRRWGDAASGDAVGRAAGRGVAAAGKGGAGSGCRSPVGPDGYEERPGRVLDPVPADTESRQDPAVAGAVGALRADDPA